MLERMKPSLYNHFVPLENGHWLIFNAISCGLVDLDAEHYTFYSDYVDGIRNETNDNFDCLVKELERGGMLVPEGVSELDVLRAGHYRARFGNEGFGLTVIPTVNCNFGCDYCYENSAIHSLSPNKGSVMSDEVCSNLINLCREKVTKKSGLSIIWYGGEPLMAMPVIKKLTREFIKLCDSRYAKYSSGMITNGYLLTAENVDFLIEAKVTFIQVTIDGPQDIHDSRRCLKSGGGTYERILANVQNITEDMPISVSIRINVDHRNTSHIPRLLDDLKRRYLHNRENISVHFGQTVRYSNSCPDIASHCMGSDEFADFMVEGFKYAVDLGFKISSFPVAQIGSCGAVGAHSALIEPDGTVQTCWAAVGRSDIAVGRLTADGITYNRNLLKWLGWTPFIAKCESCDVLPICMGGCPYKCLYKEDVPEAEENICVWWKFNIRDMLKIARHAHRDGLLKVAQSREHLEKRR